MDRRLRGFVAALVSYDREGIDEVVQATCLVAWQKLESFHYQAELPDDEFARWICTIARFEVLSYVRSARKRPGPFGEGLIERIAEVHLEESDYFEARRHALEVCVERLSERQRETLRLRYGLGLSCKEAADRLGKRPAAIVAAMARIRTALERCISIAIQREGYC